MHFFWIFNYKKGVCVVTVPLAVVGSLWLFRCLHLNTLGTWGFIMVFTICR